MDRKKIFGWLAFMFSIGTYVLYVQAILGSAAHPTISTWISWWAMDVAILAAMIAARSIAPQMVAYTLGTMVVIGVSLWRGATVGWTNLDTACLAIVIVAIVSWAVSGKPTIAIIFCVVATVVGCVPNALNVWHHPTNEPISAWLILTVGSAFGLLAVKKWDIMNALIPVVFFVLQVMFVILISLQFF